MFGRELERDSALSDRVGQINSGLGRCDIVLQLRAKSASLVMCLHLI
jgi:hypothetical protein